MNAFYILKDCFDLSTCIVNLSVWFCWFHWLLGCAILSEYIIIT